MTYKHKCFWIEIIDEDPDHGDYRGYIWSVYYNGITCGVGSSVSQEVAKIEAEAWVRDYGFEWLEVE